MPRSVTSVEITPSVLHEGQTDVIVTANVTDETGVTRVIAVAFDSSAGALISSETNISLASGNDLNGTYSGTIVIPLDVGDGLYQIVVLAANASTLEDDFSTYG